METTLNADHTDELFDKMSNLISEAILRFTEDGLEVTTADPAMVGMINLEVPESSFEDYEVNPEDEEYEHLTEEGEEGLLIGVDLENLSAIVNLFDEEITFTVDENQLVLTEGSDRFELPILNLSTDDIPSMDALDDFRIGGDLTTDQFKTMVKKLAVASDSTTITFNDDSTLEFEAGGDQMSIESSFELENVENLAEADEEEETPESAQSMFALDYLNKAEKMFRSLEPCDKVTVKMGEDFPMEMTHEADRENLTFVLAPRIEEQ